MEGKNKQIPAGYKDSPLGIIPVEWEVKRLGEFIESLETGVSVNSSEELNVSSEYGILKTSSVQKGKFYPFENKSIVKSEVDRAKCNPRKNCLIISRMNTPELVGECGYVGNDYETLFLPDRLWQTVFKKDSNLLPVFLNDVLNTDLYRLRVKEMATGTSNSMKNITKSDWLNLKISLPPLPEQQRIAEVLGAWDQGIELQAKLVESLQKRKRALMQQLLTGKKRLKGFDQAWKKVRIGDLGEVITGNTPSMKTPQYYGEFCCWATAVDFKNKYIYNTSVKLSEIGKLKARIAPINSVLVTCIASIGKNAIAKVETGFNQQINAIIPSKEFNSEFIYYQIENSIALLKEVAGAGAVQIINKSNFESIKLKLPSLPEQQAIAEILTAADREIELAQKKLEVLREQKRGLMQQLLTGKKRLKV